MVSQLRRHKENVMIKNEKAELMPARETLGFFSGASVRAIQANLNVNIFSEQCVNYQSNTIAVVQF
jgi:hypothetical protein